MQTICLKPRHIKIPTWYISLGDEKTRFYILNGLRAQIFMTRILRTSMKFLESRDYTPSIWVLFVIDEFVSGTD